MSKEYANYRARQIEDGKFFQDFVVDQVHNILGFPVCQYSSKEYQQAVGESLTGVEVKHDKKFAETGNLWIELAEKAVPRDGPYAKSGIFRGDNSWLFIIGDYDTLFVFSKRLLVLLSESGRYQHIENNTGTSVGFLLCEKDAKKYAAAILKPKANQKIMKLQGELARFAKESHLEIFADGRQTSLWDRG